MIFQWSGLFFWNSLNAAIEPHRQLSTYTLYVSRLVLIWRVPSRFDAVLQLMNPPFRHPQHMMQYSAVKQYGLGSGVATLPVRCRVPHRTAECRRILITIENTVAQLYETNRCLSFTNQKWSIPITRYSTLTTIDSHAIRPNHATILLHTMRPRRYFSNIDAILRESDAQTSSSCCILAHTHSLEQSLFSAANRCNIRIVAAAGLEAERPCPHRLPRAA